MNDTKEEIKQENDTQLFSYFLENTPPNQLVKISDISEYRQKRYGSGYCDLLAEPEIQLHCPHESCNGTRFFRYKDDDDIVLTSKKYKFIYITYLCANCQNYEKTFSLAVKIINPNAPQGECYKFGELPTYGPPVPARVIKLIGPDRDIFLKGRRCENQGLGVGAFVYYRRVVENQKNRIIAEIIKVAEKIGTTEGKLQLLNEAIKETQFNKALSSIKNAVPESLLINGNNPMTLLHSALSDGVHNLSDEDCLELASSIRIVLVELSERLSQALKDECELTNALSILMKKGKKI
jgi:hypothetical protein